MIESDAIYNIHTPLNFIMLQHICIPATSQVGSCSDIDKLDSVHITRVPVMFQNAWRISGRLS